MNNGDIYKGNFVNDKYEGYRKLIYSNRDKNKGYFKNGGFNGEGTLILQNEYYQYKGKWENGVIKDKKGKLFSTLGDYKYIGSFRVLIQERYQ